MRHFQPCVVCGIVFDTYSEKDIYFDDSQPGRVAHGKCVNELPLKVRIRALIFALAMTSIIAVCVAAYIN